MWFGLTEEYIKISSRLSQIFLLVNLEHGLKEIDKEFFRRADKFNVKIQIVMTKVDKVKE
jgi:GTP-binding protein EngB required for normal cell division